MLKSLLWKDYRHSRKLLVAIGVVALSPYVGVSVFMAIEFLREYAVREEPRGLVGGAAIWSAVLLMFMAAFLAANAFAGEKVDRSTEFFSYLPIPRLHSVASRLLLLLAVLVVGFFVNFVVANAAFDTPKPSRNIADLNLWIATMMLMIGPAWLYSTLLRSPASAAALGIGTWLLLIAALSLVQSVTQRADLGNAWLEKAYITWGLLVGGATFLGGTLVALRRTEL